MGELPAQRDLTAGLNRLPMASLLLAPDASAIAANEAWTELSQRPWGESRGDGWLLAVAPRNRQPLRAQLQVAAAGGERGSTDCQLVTLRGELWSRWWWRARPAGGLIVCVADMTVTDRDWLAAPDPEEGSDDDSGLQMVRWSARAFLDLDTRVELASTVIHRIFGIGLTLESALGMVAGSGAERVQQAVNELDELIKDIRTITLALPRSPQVPSPGEGIPDADPPRP
jgi:hypothetical protein